jgi:class 3 adenylate cyclase
MATTTTTRRLAAILAADVVGYSRLMGADEEGTHERLRVHLRELVDPKIKERRGRIVKNTGDGMLVEFSSVVDAVRCAAEVQRGMADRNAETPEYERITFRVGINLGDVIAEPDDIYGDGVNVAARLEALAEPGASASREWCETRSETSSLTRSRIEGSRASKTLRGRCGSLCCAPKPSPNCRRRASLSRRRVASAPRLLR